MGLFFTPLNPPVADWHGKTVWLIGASSGIGEATAAALHAAGARVVVSARRADALADFTQAHAFVDCMSLRWCQSRFVLR